MRSFAEWARSLVGRRPDKPTNEELKQLVEEAAALLPLWQGKAGEVTRRLIRDRERQLIEELITRHLTNEQYAYGLERVAGYREALAVIDEHLKRGAAAQIELDRRAAGRR